VRVALFVTCLVDGLFPDVGKATVALLERLGCQVEVPRAQTCCGQMHINTGYLMSCRSSWSTCLGSPTSAPTTRTG
jgi:Fe-S oxidoreductase